MARSSRRRRSASPAEPVRRNASDGGAGPAEDASTGSGTWCGGDGGGGGDDDDEGEERRWRRRSSRRQERRRQGSGRVSLGKTASGKAAVAAGPAATEGCMGDGFLLFWRWCKRRAAGGGRSGRSGSGREGGRENRGKRKGFSSVFGAPGVSDETDRRFPWMGQGRSGQGDFEFTSLEKEKLSLFVFV